MVDWFSGLEKQKTRDENFTNMETRKHYFQARVIRNNTLLIIIMLYTTYLEYKIC